VPGAEQSELEREQGAHLAKAAATYLLRLLGDTTIYIARTTLDLIDSVRRALLLRNRRKFPDRAAQINSALESLRDRKTRRWSSWVAVPEIRRIQIRLSTTLVTLAVILGGHEYIARGGRASEQIAIQPRAVNSPISSTRKDAASSASGDSQRSDADQFSKWCDAAAPGQWIIYGVEPPEVASTQLAEARAQRGAARVARKSAYDNLERLRNTNPNSPAANAARAEFLAAVAKLNAANSAYYSLASRRVQEAKPVLERGDLYQFDDFKVMSPVVMKDGGHYRMWYIGCHFVGDDYTCGVGHAESRDGVAWKKSSRPVLTIADQNISQNLHSLSLVRTEHEYLMWYSIDANPLQGNDCATVNSAISMDGLVWTLNGPVFSANCQNSGHLWQSAFYDGRTIHLWYIDYDSSSAGSLLHFTSPDGRTWQKQGTTELATLRLNPKRLWVLSDRTGGYRALFAAEDQPGHFGVLQSQDGNTWTIGDDPPKLPDLFHNGVPETPTALIESAGTLMWFAVPNFRDGSESIALAFHRETPR